MDEMLDVKIPIFAKLFGVSKDICNRVSIREWIQTSAENLVDHESYLMGEDKSHYDRRREMAEVYQGDISKLSEYLRGLYPDRAHMLDWEIVFCVYNEVNNISSTLKALEGETSTEHVEESYLDNPLNEESGVEDVNSEPVVEEAVIPEPVQVKEPVEAVEDNNENIVSTVPTVEEPHYASEDTYEKDSDLDAFFTGESVNEDSEKEQMSTVAEESDLKSTPTKEVEETAPIMEVSEPATEVKDETVIEETADIPTEAEQEIVESSKEIVKEETPIKEVKHEVPVVETKATYVTLADVRAKYPWNKG